MTWGLSSQSALPLGTRPAGTPAGAPLAGTIKLMAIGDSITSGLGDAAGNGWRKNLDTLLAGSGLTIDWVGGASSGGAPSNAHEGYPGSTTIDHLSTGTYDTQAAIVTYDPDVCIVLLGTNDANADTLTANFATNYVALMGEFEAAKSGIRYVVCYLPPSGDRKATTGRTVNIPTINTALPGIWTTLEGGGMNLTRCDLRVLSHRADHDRSEGAAAIHPSTIGYIKLAHALYPAVRNACGLNAAW